jgi:NAD-dependent dihydropyrimidine dehydrogenase PreA subunit
MGILAMDEENKAYMKYDECWYCLPCEVDCPVDAIRVEIPYLVR